MSLHVITHPWQVQDHEDGTLVRLTDRDLDATTLAVLSDDLFELVQESGRPSLYLDFGELTSVPGVLVGKLYALDRRLRQAGCRLFLHNIKPGLEELLLSESRSWGDAPEAPKTQDSFVVFVRDGSGSAWRPEDVERPAATCASYEEALAVRDRLRQSGKPSIIRFVGEAGGGD